MRSDGQRHRVYQPPFAQRLRQTDSLWTGAEKARYPTQAHRPYTPRHNGKVERSHRKDNEEFYASHRFYSFEDFKAQLAVRERAYNNFPMRPLSWRSPKQVLFAFPNV